MREKQCVITGATSGIGRAAALALGRMGASLVLIGRNQRAGDLLVKRLRPDGQAKNAIFLSTDLSSQQEVLALAQKIGDKLTHIDVLINNAGARFDTYLQSVDGIELTFATNHLSHFLLTNCLREALLRAPEARVITVSSRVHAGATGTGDWCLDHASYSRNIAYAKSKLANIMFAYDLAERFTGSSVVSNAVDPGIAATHFSRNNGRVSWLKHLLAHGLRRELISPRRAAETIVYLASADRAEGASGRYFRRNAEIESSPASHDRQARQRLWSLSESLTRPWAA